ncbi:MAG: ATP-binding protein [Chitinophagaceae bacterium]
MHNFEVLKKKKKMLAMQPDNLYQRLAMFAAIIDSSEDAIISKDLHSRVTSWNKSAERMFGYTESEMLGQLIRILLPEDRQQEEDDIIARLKRGERVEHFETIRRAKDGHELHVSLTISPIRDEEGKVTGASKIARDITRQKQNEEHLQIISEMGKSISANLDTDTILQQVTDATTRLSGAAFGAFFYNKIDAAGETYMLYALSGVPRSAFDKFGMPRNTAIFNTTFEGKGVRRSDDITADPDYGKNSPHHGMPKGHLPVVSYLAVPVISQSGVVLGGLFFGHPKTAMFTAEHEELVAAIAGQAAIALDNAKLYAEINALNSKKDQFIGFASHELKTPLTTIKGYLQIAESDAIAPKEAFKKINKQVARLEGIVADLLDISKIQAGKMDLNFQGTSLAGLIRESMESVDSNQHILRAESLPENITVMADRPKLVQVIVNLLSNALKYSDPGTTITICTQVMGDRAEIAVTDQGIGIPKEHLSNIFNQFYRVAPAKAKTEGMGLGLFISKEIMEAHGGSIWAESEPGKGSSFRIVVPLEGRKAGNTILSNP